MDNTSFKERLYLHCKKLMNEKVLSLQQTMNQLTEAANSETKSSVGDKHETARAMMQLEQEKLSRQINEALQLQSDLNSLHLNPLIAVGKGSLVSTNRELIFIAIPIGKIEFEQHTVIVISDKSPLALKFVGLNKDSSVDFNGMKYDINLIQ